MSIVRVYYCKFCGEGFHDDGARRAHQWTCKPWERKAA